MIHEAFSKSEIAKRYYALKTGEKLTNKEAANRWRMLKNPDATVLKKVFALVSREQDKILKTIKMRKYHRKAVSQYKAIHQRDSILKEQELRIIEMRKKLATSTKK